MSQNAPLTLYCNAAGQLVCRSADGREHVGVQPARAFPISAPHEGGVSLLDAERHEIAWIADLAALPADARDVLDAALAAREFMPVIEKLEAVSSFVCPSTWNVVTDRGATRFTLKGEEDIRPMSSGTLIITDAHGVQYLILHPDALDRRSRKLLDRFM